MPQAIQRFLNWRQNSVFEGELAARRTESGNCFSDWPKILSLFIN